MQSGTASDTRSEDVLSTESWLKEFNVVEESAERTIPTTTYALEETCDERRVHYRDTTLRMLQLAATREWYISAWDVMVQCCGDLRPNHRFLSTVPKDMYVMFYDREQNTNSCFFTMHGLLRTVFRERRYRMRPEGLVEKHIVSRYAFQQFLSQPAWFGIDRTTPNGSIFIDEVELPYVFKPEFPFPHFDAKYFWTALKIKSKPSSVAFQKKKAYPTIPWEKEIILEKRNFFTMPVLLTLLYKKNSWEKPQNRPMHEIIANVVCRGLIGAVAPSLRIPTTSSLLYRPPSAVTSYDGSTPHREAWQSEKQPQESFSGSEVRKDNGKEDAPLKKDYSNPEVVSGDGSFYPGKTIPPHSDRQHIVCTPKQTFAHHHIVGRDSTHSPMSPAAIDLSLHAQTTNTSMSEQRHSTTNHITAAHQQPSNHSHPHSHTFLQSQDEHGHHRHRSDHQPQLQLQSRLRTHHHMQQYQLSKNGYNNTDETPLMDDGLPFLHDTYAPNSVSSSNPDPNATLYQHHNIAVASSHLIDQDQHYPMDESLLGESITSALMGNFDSIAPRSHETYTIRSHTHQSNYPSHDRGRSIQRNMEKEAQYKATQQQHHYLDQQQQNQHQHIQQSYQYSQHQHYQHHPDANARDQDGGSFFSTLGDDESLESVFAAHHDSIEKSRHSLDPQTDIHSFRQQELQHQASEASLQTHHATQQQECATSQLLLEEIAYWKSSYLDAQRELEEMKKLLQHKDQELHAYKYFLHHGSWPPTFDDSAPHQRIS
eukprot:TRINITY_DN3557_c0_g2_i7.p2 TRINITY_DN3557_c0_g2~~TRINITY_DN3557_c0_g2_i7.p2  ORF type:complete len:764 (-),score=148.36 TRINITY_DN3557_c0_g2_i7:5360-7651(-)